MNTGIQTETVATVSSALKDAAARLSAAGIGGARLDAEILLGEALGIERGKIYLNNDRALDDAELARFRSLIARRASGEPVSYITGRREFWSLDLIVNPAVLAPRPETELLVETALGFARRYRVKDRRLRILDVGTGSGAIAVALAEEIPAAEVWASDISSDALEVARNNARRHNVEQKIRFLAGDLFAPVAEMAGGFDLIVSNPPYIRSGELATLPRDVRDYEPRLALDGGADGLDFYRRIAREAPRYLSAGGFLAVEIGAGMGEEVARLFAAAGFSSVRVDKDLAGSERVVSASFDKLRMNGSNG
ncbi:MAG TPA: peptide chain release factor N(5)-glutamine methyltransferase [Casimicrobiaceae bacterium]|nr:peptide chain release factor N(5)-glutamine methyltransferase [Casimicrobiaceae bacterium]